MAIMSQQQLSIEEVTMTSVSVKRNVACGKTYKIISEIWLDMGARWS